MPRTFHQFKAAWLTGGLHLLIVFVAIQVESARAWPYALAAMCTLSLLAWMANYRRYRQVHDLPTSKVASAAQGYVELFGRSAQIADSPVLSPLTSLPCCWYRYCIERKSSDDKWQHEDSGESVAHFLLVDDTGECVISPDGAEVLYARENTWTQGDRRYTESLLLTGGVLYALGEFRTTSSTVLELDKNKEISDLLADWKRDQARLIERFDTNRDGALDLQEWEAARLEARRQVEKEHAQTRAGEGVHLLLQPSDGRAFILAAELPEKIGRRFAAWSWGHLALFFAAGIASYFMFTGAR
jgi:hypothetical protein